MTVRTPFWYESQETPLVGQSVDPFSRRPFCYDRQEALLAEDPFGMIARRTFWYDIAQYLEDTVKHNFLDFLLVWHSC